MDSTTFLDHRLLRLALGVGQIYLCSKRSCDSHFGNRDLWLRGHFGFVVVGSTNSEDWIIHCSSFSIDEFIDVLYGNISSLIIHKAVSNISPCIVLEVYTGGAL